jgi:hypothetical protein
MTILTSSECPPFGVMDKLMPEIDSLERLQFWLLMHTSWKRERAFKTMVIKECLPGPEAVDVEDAFKAL